MARVTEVGRESSSTRGLLGVAVILSCACQPETVTPQWPELPVFREPASHAPELPPEPGIEKRPTLRLGDRSWKRPSLPEPAAQTVGTAQTPTPEPEPDLPAAKPTLEATEPPPGPSAEEEAESWLLRANLLTPGCLVDERPVEIALPSPEALAFLLDKQPAQFAGVAREALVCLLQLPRLTGAQVYGTSAFQPMAISTRAAMAGGKRSQGVVVAAVSTDEPAAQGTLVLVMEELSEKWAIRSTLWFAAGEDGSTRRFVSLREARLVSSRRPTLVIRERDRRETRDHYIDLSEVQQLTRVLTVPVRGRTLDGARTLSAQLVTRGRKWPKTAIWRAIITDADASSVWTVAEFRAEPEHAYAAHERLTGPLNSAGVRSLLSANRPIEAEWAYGKLSKAARNCAAGLRVRAEIAQARKQRRTALKYWRRAVKQEDASPQDWRDYGLFLLAQKSRSKARKKEIAGALRRYLTADPQAHDSAAIRTRLDELEGGRQK